MTWSASFARSFPTSLQNEELETEEYNQIYYQETNVWFSSAFRIWNSWSGVFNFVEICSVQ